MKNEKLLGCMLMMITGSSQLLAEPAHKAVETAQNQMISLTDLNDRVIEDFSNGSMNDMIIECTQGANLPFKVILKGEFLALESSAVSPLYLKILKTCYIRCEDKGNFLFSTDLQSWKGFSEFFTGELNVSVENENNGLVVGLQLELNKRKN